MPCLVWACDKHWRHLLTAVVLLFTQVTGKVHLLMTEPATAVAPPICAGLDFSELSGTA